MIKNIKFISNLFLISLAVQLFGANNDADILAIPLTSVAGIQLSRADVALARSVINPVAFRGSLGENVVANTFLKDTLSKTGNWQSITPRSGPQGFDHLFIKVNKSGTPTKLIVGESKFNTSQLGMTKDGIQMGEKWTNRRLSALGTRYLAVAQERSVSVSNMPLNPKQQISVILKNGQQVHFWKATSLDQWNFSGTKSQLTEAQKLAVKYGVFFKNSGNAIIPYRSRIFNLVPQGNDLQIVMYDAKHIGNAQSFKGIQPLSSIKLTNALSKNSTMPTGAQEDIARNLKTKLMLSDREAKRLARDVQKIYSPKNLMHTSSISQTIIMNSVKTSAFAMVLDATIQLASSGNVDAGRLAVSGGSVLIGTGAGQMIHVGLTNQSVFNLTKSIAGPLKCSPGMLTSSLSSVGGVMLTTALFSYGFYFMGYSDLKTANRNMIVGSAAAGAGTLAGFGIMSAASAWGTASTGTAIANLSGAAASQASLAWLGGGSIAAGGGGVTIGTVAVGGVVAIAAIGVGYIGCKLYQLKDEADENKRIRSMISVFSEDIYMDTIVNNSTFARMNMISN